MADTGWSVAVPGWPYVPERDPRPGVCDGIIERPSLRVAARRGSLPPGGTGASPAVKASCGGLRNGRSSARSKTRTNDLDQPVLDLVPQLLAVRDGRQVDRSRRARRGDAVACGACRSRPARPPIWLRIDTERPRAQPAVGAPLPRRLSRPAGGVSEDLDATLGAPTALGCHPGGRAGTDRVVRVALRLTPPSGVTTVTSQRHRAHRQRRSTRRRQRIRPLRGCHPTAPARRCPPGSPPARPNRTPCVMAYSLTPRADESAGDPGYSNGRSRHSEVAR